MSVPQAFVAASCVCEASCLPVLEACQHHPPKRRVSIKLFIHLIKKEIMYTISSVSQVLAPAEAGEQGDPSESRAERNQRTCCTTWSRAPLHDQKEDVDKARGQAQIEAVDNIISNKAGWRQKGSHLLSPGHSECGGPGALKPRKDGKSRRHTAGCVGWENTPPQI